MNSVKVKLIEPVEAHGKTTSEIELKRPRAAQIIKHGYPMKITADGVVEFKADIVAAYIADLAGIPPSSVALLSIMDFQSLLGEIVSFFAGSPPTSSTSSES